MSGGTLVGAFEEKAASTAETAYKPTIVDLSLGVPRTWPRIWHIAAAIAVCVGHVLLADPYYTRTTAICAGLEAAVLVLLATRYMTVRLPRLHWIENMFAIHYLQFGLPILAEPITAGSPWPRTPRTESFETASILGLAGGLAMIAAFALFQWAFRRFSGERMFPKLDPETLAKSVQWYVPIAAAFVVSRELVPRIDALLLPVLAIIQQFFFHSQLLVIATVAYLAAPRRSTLAQMLIASGAIASLLIITSGLSKLLVPFMGVLVLWWRARERLPIVTLTIVAAVVIVIQPVKKYYREVRWIEGSQTGVFDAWSEAFSRATAKQHSAFADDPREHGTEGAVARLNAVAAFAYVVEVVPESVAYGEGSIYPKMAVAAVPRIFWPEKPNMTEYALDSVVITLGLLPPEESGYTVTGITLPAQGYYEHGAAGAIGWMALFGALLALLSRYFGPKLPGVIAGAAVMANLGLAQEGGFFNIFGGIWQLVLGTTLLPWLLWVMGGKLKLASATAVADNRSDA